jgi:fatty-acyl-CoA synthase
VPTQYQQLHDSPRWRATDFSSVRFMTTGGAAMPVPLIQAWQAVHAVPFKQGFGMTEFGPGIFSMGPEFAVSKAGSIGRPNYFIAAKLVDDDGREVPVDEVGELVLKGPSMCSGYFEDEAATREAIDAGGWFHTGDLARKDADGFFTIAGRKKDMFISGGENVYPLELETALYEHAGVQQCSVIGVPDAKWGEVGRAFVVLKADAKATAEELLEYLRGRVARFKVPKRVELVERLPVSPAGKILKRELREAALASDARATQESP